MDWTTILKDQGNCRWELPKDYLAGMRVPGLVFTDEAMLRQMGDEQAIQQVANVAFLPGIIGYSIAMPDIHWGYGFPIGGVAATRVDGDGVVSPGGVGFDINCGVRMLRTNLLESDVRPKLRDLIATLFREVPTGVAESGRGRIRLKPDEVNRVLVEGGPWAVKQGMGHADDLEVTEEQGRIADADPDAVGERPKKRGAPQLGTLGSGNHFLEVQAVDEIFDLDAAVVMGIREVGQVTVMVHCGSRGLGHQVCTDYLKTIERAGHTYGIELPDRQLASVPIASDEGRGYFAAMRAAANFAWANRQAIAHWTRMSFEQVFRRSWEDMGIWQVYDVSHNMAKIEEHLVDGVKTRLCVHRKGATRSFPPGSPDIPARYRRIGQPVLIPGDMGRASYLAVGVPSAMALSWGSACHGAGRLESRTSAKKLLKGHDIKAELEQQGIIAMAQGWASLAEEASLAYKDIADVVRVCDTAGLCRRVARLRPLGVIKG
ncbi:MAG: RtcB family protein [SAR202 cluster bacterium]|nr:RtcB family protein [SAR202 cluster bacterium]